jgi:hypothetical protein
LRVKIEMSSKRASVNPLAGFLKPGPQLKGWLLSSRTVRSCRERQLKELQEEEAKARGEAGKRPVGQPRGSKNKPPSLTAHFFFPFSFPIYVCPFVWLLLHVTP